MKRCLVFIIVGVFLLPILSAQEHSRARELNEVLLQGIRRDFARPTVHARNLYHTSIAMYDAWAAYQDVAQPFCLGDTLHGFYFPFEGTEIPATEDAITAAQEEAMTYAVYRIMIKRFIWSPRFDEIEVILNDFMAEKGLDIDIESTDYLNDSRPAVLGNYIGELILDYGVQDGSNERNLFQNEHYRPVNSPLILQQSGIGEVQDPNRWQPLAFNLFIDQSGNQIPSNVPSFLSPEWGIVDPFAMDTTQAVSNYDDNGNLYKVYYDPGEPPYLTDNPEDESSINYKWGFSLVSLWSSMLDPADSVMWDISPKSIGNIPELPGSDDLQSFYNLIEGGDISQGRDMNPITGEPYVEQLVPRADYARVLAEFWADGPDSETPPGHWFTILHTVTDHPMFRYQWMGEGAILDPLEYDVKSYLTLGGAMHDAAISAWGIKGWYDYIRPISAIRYMASLGQSSDTSLANYHPRGIPLIEGFIELVGIDDTLAVDNPSAVDMIKLYAWKGPSFIEDPVLDIAGVDWILADDWWPYQRPTFVTPPFAGYISGHSTYSRAAAEVLTLMTGDEYFPGGMGVFEAPKDDFLVFEKGPSVDMQLQWATYRDASDQTSLSRIWGGIHPPADDIPGRIIGMEIGIEAFNFANSYFNDVTSPVKDLPIVTDMFTIAPNPANANGHLTIHSNGLEDEVRILLTDISGKILRYETIRPELSNLDLLGIESGIYFLQISTDTQRQLEKVIIH